MTRLDWYGHTRALPATELGRRLEPAVRFFALTVVLVGTVGLAGRLLAWPLLTSTIGPTAYLFAAHPTSEAARFRNALIGHGVGIAIGLAMVASFGLTNRPPVTDLGMPSLRQVLASALAVGMTMFTLELLGSHHAPVAATALLISTGLAKPGAPLIGLVLGLAIVIVLGPLCKLWPVRIRPSLPPSSTSQVTSASRSGRQ